MCCESCEGQYACIYLYACKKCTGFYDLDIINTMKALTMKAQTQFILLYF